MHIVNVKQIVFSYWFYVVLPMEKYCPCAFPPRICYSGLTHNLSNFSNLISLRRTKDVPAEYILEAKSGNFYNDKTNTFITHLNTILIQFYFNWHVAIHDPFWIYLYLEDAESHYEFE